MEQVSELMRDQLEHPLDRAVYWIEYVIRHQGAPHLRTSSRQLSLLQRGLLDVIFVGLSACTVIIYFLYSLLSSCCKSQRLKVDIVKKNK